MSTRLIAGNMTAVHSLQVSKGRVGLRPLIGGYRITTPSPTDLHVQGSRRKPLYFHYIPDVQTIKPRDVFTRRVSSLKVPPTKGPADIGYLRSRLGFCMATEEQVLHEQSLVKAKRSPHEFDRPKIFDISAATKAELPKCPFTPSQYKFSDEDLQSEFSASTAFGEEKKKLAVSYMRNRDRAVFDKKIAYIQRRRIKVLMADMPNNTAAAVPQSARTTEYLSKITRMKYLDERVQRVQNLRKARRKSRSESLDSEEKDELLLRKLSDTVKLNRKNSRKNSQKKLETSYRRWERAHHQPSSDYSESTFGSDRDKQLLSQQSSRFSKSLASETEPPRLTRRSTGQSKDSVRFRADSVKSRVDSLKPRADSMTSRADSMKSRADSVKSRADSVKSRADSVRSRADSQPGPHGK